jgi:N-acetyl-gamma-glutamyl-phosphate reductase
VFSHGKSIQFLEQNQFGHTKIIDLGNDFRLTKDKKFKGKSLFTVCLNSIKPILEMPNTQIRDVLPLRYNWFYYRLQRIIKDRCPYQCYNGSTGAGVSPSETISAGDQITCRITKHSTTSI